MSLASKAKRLIEFVVLLRIEPYLLIFIFVMYLKKVPFDQLIQDKICRQRYNLSDDYCLRLPEMTPEEDVYEKKSVILGDVTQFNFYVSLITTVPGVVFSLFIGSWTDRYPNAKKVLLLLGAIAGVVESVILTWNAVDFELPFNYMLLSFIPTAIMGGNITCYTALWSYVASTTTPKLRAIRMTIMELCIYTAYLISTYSAGQILFLTPLFSDKQLHNYSTIFVINIVANFLAVIWTLLVVNEKAESKMFAKKFPVEEISSTNDLTVSNSNVYMAYDNTIDSGVSVTGDKPNSDVVSKSFVNVISGKSVSDLDAEVHAGDKICDIGDEIPDKRDLSDTRAAHPLSMLFEVDNMKQMVITCLKRRPNYARLQLWLIFVSTICYLLAYISPLIFLYQFAQRVYEWNAETYSTWNSLAAVANALATLALIPILVKAIKMRDTIIALLGLVTYMAQNLLRAIILSPTGFYVSIVFGALGSITAVGIKAHASKIVEHSELGKVFSLMSALEATTPLVASTIFTFMFQATVDSAPGVNFYITAGFLMVPILIFIWIDRFTTLPIIVNSQ